MLSPSAISTYLKSKEEFYLRYLAPVKPPVVPQTEAMAVGSAFDAYVKSYLYKSLFGNKDPRYSFEALFESQVEPHVRDFARDAGALCWAEYSRSGALMDLLLDMKSASIEPRFEFDLFGVVFGKREGLSLEVDSVGFKGKPDAYYVTRDGVRVILDWKVNGYMSSASPMKGYVRLWLDGQYQGSHKECVIGKYHGTLYNKGTTLDKLNNDWARQLSIYAWLIGEEVGSDFLVAIDQLACRDTGIRVAEHRLFVDPDAQKNYFEIALTIDRSIKNKHLFNELSKEENDKKYRYLDDLSYRLHDENDMEAWLYNQNRRF